MFFIFHLILHFCLFWNFIYFKNFFFEGETPQFKASVEEKGDNGENYDNRDFTSGPEGNSQIIEFDLFTKTVIIRVVLFKKLE